MAVSGRASAERERAKNLSRYVGAVCGCWERFDDEGAGEKVNMKGKRGGMLQAQLAEDLLTIPIETLNRYMSEECMEGV